MFIIERLIGEEWKFASSHSHEVDADAQMQRFLDSGISASELRLRTE